MNSRLPHRPLRSHCVQSRGRKSGRKGADPGGLAFHRGASLGSFAGERSLLVAPPAALRRRQWGVLREGSARPHAEVQSVSKRAQPHGDRELGAGMVTV